MNMTISEVRTAQRKLEAEITQLVRGFEKATGVDVCSVHLHRVQAMGCRHEVERVEMDTRIGRY